MNDQENELCKIHNDDFVKFCPIDEQFYCKECLLLDNECINSHRKKLIKYQSVHEFYQNKIKEIKSVANDITTNLTKYFEEISSTSKIFANATNVFELYFKNLEKGIKEILFKFKQNYIKKYQSFLENVSKLPIKIEFFKKEIRNLDDPKLIKCKWKSIFYQVSQKFENIRDIIKKYESDNLIHFSNKFKDNLFKDLDEGFKTLSINYFNQSKENIQNTIANDILKIKSEKIISSDLEIEFAQKLPKIGTKSISSNYQINIYNSKIGKKEKNLKRQDMELISKFFPLKNLYFDKELYEPSQKSNFTRWIYYVENNKSTCENMLHLKSFAPVKIYKIKLYDSNGLNTDASNLNDILLFCGGSKQNPNNQKIEYLNQCNVFDLKDLKDPTKVSNCTLSEKKCNISLIAIKDSMYCLGGFNGKALSTCEHFHDALTEWKKTSALNYPNYCITSLFIESSNVIYVLGGATNDGFERLFIDNSLFEGWRKLAITTTNYSYSREYGAAVVINKYQILIFGGKASNSEMMIYDLNSNSILKTGQNTADNILLNTSKAYLDLEKNFIYVISTEKKKRISIDLITLNYNDSEDLDF